MAWYKARYGTSAGHSDWKYINITPSKKKEVLVVDIEAAINAPTWSEHYRGIEYRTVKIEDIPREVILKKAEDAKRLADAYTNSHTRLLEEAKKCKRDKVLKPCPYCRKRGVGKFDCFVCKGTGKRREYDV